MITKNRIFNILIIVLLFLVFTKNVCATTYELNKSEKRYWFNGTEVVTVDEQTPNAFYFYRHYDYYFNKKCNNKK